MMSQVVSRFPHPELVALALPLFLMVFLGAALWIYRRGSGEMYRRMVRMPLESEEENRHE